MTLEIRKKLSGKEVYLIIIKDTVLLLVRYKTVFTNHFWLATLNFDSIVETNYSILTMRTLKFDLEQL